MFVSCINKLLFFSVLFSTNEFLAGVLCDEFLLAAFITVCQYFSPPLGQIYACSVVILADLLFAAIQFALFELHPF